MLMLSLHRCLRTVIRPLAPAAQALRPAGAGLLLGLGLSLASAAHAAEPAKPAAGAEAPVLNIYNWSDYIADDTLKNFEKETGIKVRYDNYDTNEILHAKLVAGKSGYDIVVPSAHFAKQQIDGKLLRKLDRSKLTHWGNLDPALLAQMAKVDPDNQYLVDWLWGYVTVGINTVKVKQALGGEALPADPWKLLFDPAYVKRLKSCGVSLLDSASEVLPVAMFYAGKPGYSRNAADYPAAAAVLKAMRPYVTRFSSSGYINELVDGSLCLVLGYSGDINIARSRAMAAGQGDIIQALVPPSGATLFFDSMAIPADAPHPNNAHRFIDYILRPEVHASLSNKVFYANPNKASMPFVKPEVAKNPSVFPSAEALARMNAPEDLPQAIRRVQTRVFTQFKAGQ
jgi:putrescine transport system substrate-binding protein